ncbi:MAG: ATP-binding protein [Verrucomicrobiota bacterium]
MQKPLAIHTRMILCLILTVGLLAALAFSLPGILAHNTRYEDEVARRVEALAGTDLSPERRQELRSEVASLQAAHAGQRDDQVMTIWILMAVVMVLAGFMQWAVGRSIVQPLVKLRAAVRRLQDGNFSSRAKLKTGDEIEGLGDAFDRMAASIEQSREELEDKNRTLSQQQEDLREMNEQLEQRVDAQTEKLQVTLLKEEAERTKLETIITRMPDGLLLLNERGTVIRANQAALTILGHRNLGSVQDWIDRAPGAFAFRRLDHETIPWEEFPFNRAFRGEGFSNQVLYVRRPDNSTRLVSFSGGAVVGQGLGGTQLSVVIFRDVTEELALRKELEETNLQLNEASRMKDEFLAQLSHELRTPLSPIVASAQLMQMEESLEEEDRHALAVIERNALALSRMIDELLSLSSLMNAKLRLERAPVSLNEWLRETVDGVRPGLERRGQSCEVAYLDEDLRLNVDAARLTQVLANLLNNASKYSDEGSAIAVRLLRANEQVRVTVEDRGVGLNQHELNEIFQMFHQTRSALGRGVSGLGLGLSIAKSLAELHGGGIEARSEGPGQGSAFTLWLPLAPNRVESTAETAPPARAAEKPERHLLRGRRVLLVEDSTDTIEVLARILRRRQCQVLTATSAKEALETARREHPEIILSDLGLPDMDGLELIRALRAEPGNGDLVAVSLSGRGRDVDRRQSLAAGFDAHLVKPVEMTVLDRCLAEALAKNGAEPQAEKTAASAS